MGENGKGNGKVEVPQEVLDLVGGLKEHGDLGDVYFLLSRIGSLSQLIRAAAEDERGVTDLDETTVIEACYWIRKLIEDIIIHLDNQDSLVRKLRVKCLPDDEILQGKESLKAQSWKVRALRHLTNLFEDSRGHGTYADLGGVRAWCRAYDYDFETVRGLLEGPEEEIKGACPTIGAILASQCGEK